MGRHLWVTGSALVQIPDEETEPDVDELVGKYWDDFEWEVDYYGIDED